MKIIEQYTKHTGKAHLYIVEAHYIGDFKISLTFNDGSTKMVSFRPFLENAKHPAIKKYLDEEQFKNYDVKDGNLDWNNFDMCFPIEDLYKNTILKKEKAV